jgi:hypothetical protein
MTVFYIPIWSSSHQSANKQNKTKKENIRFKIWKTTQVQSDTVGKQ